MFFVGFTIRITSQNYEGLKISVSEFKILPFRLRVFHDVTVGDIQKGGPDDLNLLVSNLAEC